MKATPPANEATTAITPNSINEQNNNGSEIGGHVLRKRALIFLGHERMKYANNIVT